MRIPIPEWLVDRIIVHARSTPYYHLPGYMNRWWLLGYDCKERNRNSENWDGDHRAAQRSKLYHLITRHVGIRLHQTVRSDREVHLHDHPGWSISIVLRGGFYERLPINRNGKPEWTDTGVELYCSVWRAPGSIILRRRATDRHSLTIPHGKDCWTIFIVGQKTNEWGFYTPSGRIPWRQYLGLK